MDPNGHWATPPYPIPYARARRCGPTGLGFVEPVPTRAYTSQKRKELSMGKTLRIPDEPRFV
jgi:hypothetical protein